MSFINVAEWTPHHVVQWLQGLEDSILPYVNFFLENQINGCRLLSLNSEDLDKLNVKKIGHQEIILDAIDLLKHLHYSFKTETLQILALRLGCKSRSLYNQLKKENDCKKCDNCLNKPNLELSFNLNETNFDWPSKIYEKNFIEKHTKRLCKYVTTSTLSAVCDILVSVKQFISWIDKYSFERQDYYNFIRKTILRISIELASTAQRDHFVENAKEIIKLDCFKFAELCDRIVQELNDSLAIQPAILEVVPIKRKQDEELGMNIYSSYSGIHIVGAIKIQSPTHRCGRVEEGDEIIQINYQTVIGWQQNKLVGAMKEYPTEILITIKKRPKHSNIVGQLVVLKPYKIPQRKVCSKQISNFIPNFQKVYSENGFDKNQTSNNDYLEQTNLININQNNKANDSIYYTNRNICNQNHEDEVLCEQNKNENKQLIEKLSAEKPAKGPVYQMLMKKPKKLRRRATISGSSPTAIYPPIKIEDLVNLDKNEVYFFNKELSIKTSHLNLDSDSNNQLENQEQEVSKFDQEFCNNYNNNQSSVVVKRKNKANQKYSEDYYKKRTISVCCSEIYGINNEFFKQNYFQPNCVNDKKKQSNEIFNEDMDNVSISRNKFNNATIISLNESSQSTSNFSITKVDFLPKLDYSNKILEENKNEKKFFKSNEINDSSLQLKNNHQDETIKIKSKEKVLKNTSQNKQKHKEQISMLNVGVSLSNDLLNTEMMNLKINSDFDSCLQQANQKRQAQLKKKPEIPEKKNLFKQAKMNQLYKIADFKGWFSYIKEESANNNLFQSSSPNFENNQTLWLNKKLDFWIDNYLILKNNLLYFFENINEIQPYRIIDVFTFKLFNKIELIYGKQAFKIQNSQCIFYFTCNDIENLKKLILKIHNSIQHPVKIQRNNEMLFTYSNKNDFHTNEVNFKKYGSVHSVKNFHLNSDLKNEKFFFPLNSKSKTEILLTEKCPKDDSAKSFLQNSNYSSKKGYFVRSVSCLDSNLINQTKNRTKIQNELEKCNILHSSSQNVKIYSSHIPNEQEKINQNDNCNFKINNVTYSENGLKFCDSQNDLNQSSISNQKKLLPKKQVPKPQPRTSKMKEQNSNLVGKIINSFDELSKQCEKELDQFSNLKKSLDNSETTKLNTVFNSFPRNTPVKWDSKKEVSDSKEQNYVSVLDREYNRLFGNKPFSKTLNFPVEQSSQTFLKNFETNNVSKEDHNFNHRSTSPNSDNSLSSSSGISSYYSMGQDTNSNNQKLTQNNLTKNDTLTTNKKLLSSSFSLNFSPTCAKDSNFSLFELSNEVNNLNSFSYSSNESPKINDDNSKIEKQKSLNRKPSLKLFGSSKALSRFGSMSKNLEDKSNNKSKSFLYSPSLKKVFFGNKKNSLVNEIENENNDISKSKVVENGQKNMCSISIQTEESLLNRTRSESLGILNNFACNEYFQDRHQSFKQQSLRIKPTTFNLNNRYINNPIDFPATPETPRKPTMGVSMLSKKRTSFVSTDKAAIETALLNQNDKLFKMHKNFESN